MPVAEIGEQKLRSRIPELARSHARWADGWSTGACDWMAGRSITSACDGSGERMGSSAPCCGSESALVHQTALERW
jgi:hypothetical protein